MVAQPGAGGAAGRRAEPCAAAAGFGGACALRSHGTLRSPLRRPPKRDRLSFNSRESECNCDSVEFSGLYINRAHARPYPPSPPARPWLQAAPGANAAACLAHRGTENGGADDAVQLWRFCASRRGSRTARGSGCAGGRIRRHELSRRGFGRRSRCLLVV